MAAPRGVRDIEVASSQRCPLGGLRWFPHRCRWCWPRRPILGTLHVWGVHDDDIWLLAGGAKPASVTVAEDSLGSPCVGGTLSSCDIAEGLLPVVPVEISFPVGPVDSPTFSR